ncbi:hypothetical protein [Burkholderia vietnamiensis]|uniref:hypothetical protein n=1 Tax=Burkholderia vietnamiensis TaxID=60552 RepID=UPI001CB38750|nr:hypothetical protein [Burkholderia vietnamiensis]CAG9229353.1 hypothetical protein BVI1335_70196 [Burkholderia vietnamiensis]
MKNQKMNPLDTLTLGDRDGNWQEIDTADHGGIAKVVVGIQDDGDPCEDGIELAKRIVALPKLIGALQSISTALEEGSDSIFDAMTTAREALDAAGIER